MKLPFFNKTDRRNKIEAELLDLHAKIHSQESYAAKVSLTHRYAELQREYQRRFGEQFDIESRVTGRPDSSMDDLAG